MGLTYGMGGGGSMTFEILIRIFIRSTTRSLIAYFLGEELVLFVDDDELISCLLRSGASLSMCEPADRNNLDSRRIHSRTDNPCFL